MGPLFGCRPDPKSFFSFFLGGAFGLQSTILEYTILYDTIYTIPYHTTRTLVFTWSLGPLAALLSLEVRLEPGVFRVEAAQGMHLLGIQEGLTVTCIWVTIKA